VKEAFQKWTRTTDGNEKHYDRQTRIVAKALATKGHSLNTLLELMRADGEPALYLCGTRLDSDYAFGSNDLGTAISTLPEDATKAAVPGYHPGSTEVYVIFQGNLEIELLDQGAVHTRDCCQFDVVVIPPGQCHRVRNQPGRKAASFIVKTNPHHKPGVVRCDDCTYYSLKEDCPVYMGWAKEEA